MGCIVSTPPPGHPAPVRSDASVGAVAAPAAAEPMMKVMCPADGGPGSIVQAACPDGRVLQFTVPPGVAPGQVFQVRYPAAPGATASTAPAPAATSQRGPEDSVASGAAPANSVGNVNTAKSGWMSSFEKKARDTVLKSTGKDLNDYITPMKDKVTKASTDFKQKMTDQMDAALVSTDQSRLNSVLDSAMAGRILGHGSAPASVKRAANQVAARQLQDAINSEDPKRLKGALVAAKRLNAIDMPEFSNAIQKYQEVKKLPAGWDVSKMLLHREGDKMVAKLEMNCPAVHAKFQRLLDLTYRKVYTRDRMGEGVPERLELMKVVAITNDDLWGKYVTRRELVRQELEVDSEGFEKYTFDTMAPKASEEDFGESAESISEALAADFGEPLLSEVNEAFLFHGTSADAAQKITTNDFMISMAGSNAGTLFGRGLYLAENCTKSDEYTRPMDTGERCLLICRATLGRMFYWGEKETDPRMCEDKCLRDRYHAVLGDRKKCRGTFREVVIFDEEQVYPNYILTYRRVDPKVDPKRSIRVMCPEGAGPGGKVEVQDPSGHIIHVVIPPGIGPGMTFLVQY
eukprot:TRINITY_DN29903_c0_g1_i1.p1 TRINITY_DN29903_c0_g1~~TRINITY_DN29903_c0_g1_i1.p1  ORF type:complete len:574 (+),score=129.57 TRINITY_DN29903_c0_g1_i1:163-1884(+)